MRGPPARITVVIPNFNGKSHVPDCLRSLDRQSLRDFEVIVVDNASTDGSRELVQSDFPWVSWVGLAENHGFSFAVNRGIGASNSDLIALLNNDTVADARWLERLVAAFDEVPEASFAASKLLTFHSPHLIDAAGDGYSLPRSSARNIGAGRPSSSYAARAWVFGASAAAAAYRRSLFADIGMFDEDFFYLFEDVDFAFRAQLRGHRCLFVPDAIVYHKRGASADRHSIEVQARALRNEIWAPGRNLSPSLLLAWWICFLPRLAWLLAQVAVTGHYHAKRNDPKAPVLLRLHALVRDLQAVMHAIRTLPAKRREVRVPHKLRSVAMLRLLTSAHRQASRGPER
jgi:GT2 family glycosyltransferase